MQGIEPATTGLQDEWFIHYITTAPTGTLQIVCHVNQKNYDSKIHSHFSAEAPNSVKNTGLCSLKNTQSFSILHISVYLFKLESATIFQ